MQEDAEKGGTAADGLPGREPRNARVLMDLDPDQRELQWDGPIKRTKVTLAMLAELFQHGKTAIPVGGADEVGADIPMDVADALGVIETNESPDNIMLVFDVMLDVELLDDEIDQNGEATYHVETPDGEVSFGVDREAAERLHKLTGEHIVECERREREREADA